MMVVVLYVGLLYIIIRNSAISVIKNICEVKMWQNIVKKIVIFGLNYLYNYVDKNDDGKISKEELITIKNDLNKLVKMINSKIKK